MAFRARRRLATRRRLLCLVLSLVALCSSTSTTQNVTVGDDFYYYGDTRVHLQRSTDEVVVAVDPSAVAGTDETIRSLLPDAGVSGGPATADRAYRIVKLPPDRQRERSAASLVDTLAGVTAVDFAAPVFRHRDSGARLLPTDEVIVKTLPGQDLPGLQTVATALGLEVQRPLRGAVDQYVLKVAAGGDALSAARSLYESGAVAWAEPNFVQDYRRSAVPNDPRFDQQWHLRNTGQTGGVAGADIKATAAWDIEQGSPDIVIAIIDDGVDVAHPDLSANIAVNTDEIAGNGVDDDQNGYVDDVRGWDFVANDNDAQPAATDDNHGTAVAGVAAARGGNAIGVTGICQRCRILPLKIFNGVQVASTDRVAEAIRYATGRADVINNSWGGGAPSNAIGAAIEFATTAGRNGRGSVVIAAAGNRAGGNVELVAPSIRAGTHRFRWTYSKDESVSAGDDAAWLASVVFPGGEVVTFDGEGLPAGWVTGGDAAWSTVVDPLHADEGVCSLTSLRSGAIGHSQSTYVEVVKTVPAGGFAALQFVSSEEGFDGLRVQIDLDNNGSYDLGTGTFGEVPPTGISYPAAYPASIGVGASSNFDCRSPYSQTGSALTLVAPGSAGPLNPGIHTTDRTGSIGYVSGDYVDDFGGTSSSTPLVAGVAGLMLSRNPQLTPTSVRAILQSTADKIGPQPYTAGRNDRYGAGRLNAQRALEAVALPSTSEPPAIVRQPLSQVVPSGEVVRLSVGAPGVQLTYQWYRGASGDVSAPVAGATSPVFDTPPVTLPVSFWVRVSNSAGAADSTAAALEVGASWDASLRVVRCGWLTALCDSGRLLNGRSFVDGELHQPNTLAGCADGTARSPINRVERIRIESVNGGEFTSGESVRVVVETVTSLAPAQLALYINAGGNGSLWTRFASLSAPFPGPHTFTATVTLPPAASIAFRAQLTQSTPSDVPCTFVENGVDHDDILIAASNVAGRPFITRHPTHEGSASATLSTISVTAIGTAPLSYQWYTGATGDTTSPMGGKTSSSLTVPVMADQPVSYWVRVSNSHGSVDSQATIVWDYDPATAVYDPVFRAPRCGPGTYCSSSTSGRGVTAGFPEGNHPNTIFGSCQDGSGGRAGVEYISSINVDTVDRRLIAPGRRVRIVVSFTTVSTLYNFVEVYHAADANAPVWKQIAATRPAIGGLLTTEIVLPDGPLQAIRARIRYQGSPGPCGSGGPDAYDDHDDLIFATTASGPMAPVIATQPESQRVPEGVSTALQVDAVGSGLSFQWFRGTSGDLTSPIAGATAATLAVQAVSGPRPYWVRVTSATGTVESATATVLGVKAAAAAYDTTLKVPVCSALVAWCDSVGLLSGRGPLGPEANAPNTLFATCQDGRSGRWQTDESIEAVRVAAVDGGLFEEGSVVKVDVTAFIVSYVSNFVDLYYADDALAPVWRHIATLTPPAGGLQTLSSGYTLPAGQVQAIRARLRYRTIETPCGSSNYDDHDDLVFAVGTPYTPASGNSISLTPTPLTTTALTTTTVTTATSASAMNAASEFFLYGSEAPANWSGAPVAGDDSAAAEARVPDEDSTLSEDAALELRDRAARVAEVTEPPLPSPTPVPESFRSGYGAPRQFELTYRLEQGRPLDQLRVRFDEPLTTSDPAETCVVHVDRASGTIRLLDEKTAETTSGKAGTDGTLQNAHCAIDLAAVRVAGTDEALVLRVTARFTERYAAHLRVYTQTTQGDTITAWTEQATEKPAERADALTK